MTCAVCRYDRKGVFWRGATCCRCCVARGDGIPQGLSNSTAHPGIKVLSKKVRQSPEPSLSPKGRRPPFAARFVALGSHDVRQCMEGSSVQRGCAAPLEWLFGRSCRSYHIAVGYCTCCSCVPCSTSRAAQPPGVAMCVRSSLLWVSSSACFCAALSFPLPFCFATAIFYPCDLMPHILLFI